MARAAVLGRLTWRAATVTAVLAESATARTVSLDVPGWPGHLAGQHVDLRLTAADGYTATRAYSIASADDGTEQLDVTVEQVPDGEVSGYLTTEVRPGDRLEVRGPVGGWFVWRPDDPAPVQLIGGGSGVVPLMAMIRARQRAGSAPAMHLLYSVRDPDAVLYRGELDALVTTGSGDAVRAGIVYTRRAPAGWDRPPGRLDQALIARHTLGRTLEPTCYVCGPSAFVETVAHLLTEAGHHPDRIRTERFGPSGGRR